MDFGLTPDQEAIRDTARRFARERLAPGYQAREDEARLDRDLVREMGGLGILAPNLPSEYGGIDADGVTAALIAEEIAYADFGVSYMQLIGSGMGMILNLNAGDDIRQAWLPRLAAGEALIGLGLTEPRGGSDAANLITAARRDGGDYVIDGEKTSISCADQMDAIVVFARTGAPEDGARGVSAFFVPMDTPGISTTRFRDVGTKVIGRGSVFFEDVRVPARAMIGAENQGFAKIMNGFDYTRAVIGLQCVGAAQASVDETWQYLQERQAFGQPLAKFQGASFPLAEAETKLTAARALCYRTIWLRDQGLPHTAEAAMCKWWAPRTAVGIIHDCLLLHGHSGYSMDLPHQQRLRDVMGLEIGDGTAQVMKMIVARERIGRMALQY
ncbi:MAG: acyl-CoA dehydrogenase family protein [Alphaproteobacteria bacterium]